MNILFAIGEWLLVLTFLGLIGAFVWLIVAGLKLKNGIVRDVKSLYQRPMQSVKNIMATGKGIGQQEGVRLRHIAASGKRAVSSVQETAAEVKIASDAIRHSDIKPIIANIQNAIKLVELASSVMRTTQNQKKHV